MESVEERRIRIREKSKRQFLILIAVILGFSAYIAFFTGEVFLEAAPERAAEE